MTHIIHDRLHDDDVDYKKIYCITSSETPNTQHMGRAMYLRTYTEEELQEMKKDAQEKVLSQYPNVFFGGEENAPSVGIGRYLLCMSKDEADIKSLKIFMAEKGYMCKRHENLVDSTDITNNVTVYACMVDLFSFVGER